MFVSDLLLPLSLTLVTLLDNDRFVPQANRALRYFNIYLNTKRPPRKWSLNPLNLFRSSAALSSSTSTSPTPGLARVPSSSGLRTSRSRSPQSSSSSSSSSSFSAISSRNPVPLAPLPPANNPRGELIFSSKVSQHYRDGYDKYRSDWERRRQSTRKPELSYTAWLASFIFPSYGSSKLSTNKDMKTSSPKKKNANSKEEEKRNSSSYAEQSDSSSVEQSSVPPPSSSTPSRGRDSRTRPLARSGSSSSISSAASGSYIPSQTISRRSSPLRQGDSVAISSSRVSLTSASPAPSPSDGSSRASTPDLIREEEEDNESYAGYRQHPRRSSNLTGSSVSISTVSSQSFQISASTRRREQQFIRGSKSRSEGERYDDSVNDDDDDDTLPSPPDLSPNSKQANLPDPMMESDNGMKKIKRRSRASSFNEFLAELREEGLDT